MLVVITATPYPPHSGGGALLGVALHYVLNIPLTDVLLTLLIPGLLLVTAFPSN